MASARLTVTGTFVGTITFEGTEDGTNYFAISTPQNGTLSSATTTTGIYDFSVTNLQNIRARISAYTSGAITVTGHTSPVTTTTHTVQAGGNVASGTTDAGNPVKTGGKYNATAPTLTDGQRGDMQLDANGNLKVTQATLIAGEDLTNNKMVVEQRYSYMTPISTATTTTVKSGAGYIDELWVLGGTLGNVTVYDSASGTGTVIVPTFTPVANQVLIKHVSFSTGLTIVTAAATIIVGSIR